MEARVFDLDDLGWQRLRQDLTTGVSAKPLHAAAAGGLKLMLTRVEPGGEFARHADPYHHLFWFVEGEGVGWLGDKTYAISPGRVAQVPAGTSHGYRNTGDVDLVLLTVNLPVGE
ncbi:hypothetical protein DESUT3_31810 [Desulfuromonas versatilis]|uniref:Cupin type-2 domain-containing protein n=1 Tax=Desulfuromonas versatilis TaxID=2802975 RepID=A0ABM8HW13_9BACT|nr:cupin domain-containing protein [Desulfuromonas versatilis]BCR06112.1 hypothetical protein DESUT3_31810 [Desulfuromonas versatilis]